jgi:hypothetical protein
MATGDFQFFFDRFMSKLPRGWFPSDGQNIQAVAGGAAEALAQSFSDLQFVQAQGSIDTASGLFLDMASVEFFGFGNLPRRDSELDDPFRARMKAELLRPRGTRAAVADVLFALTGYEPVIFEPIRDAAAYGYSAYGSGIYGSYKSPRTFWVDVKRGRGVGDNAKSGWDTGGYGTMAYASSKSRAATVADAEIYRVIRLTIPAGVRAYVRIHS